MTVALVILLATVYQVPDYLVAMVGAFAPLPVERLTGVVLIPGGLTVSSNLGESVREVVE